MRWFRGVYAVSLFGAKPELCLNRWTAADLSFWKLEKRTEMEYHCQIYESDYPFMKREAEKAQCELRILSRSGLPGILERIRGRAILALGCLTAMILAYCSQFFVWFVQIEGLERLSPEIVKQALMEDGVSFGAWGPGIHPEEIKNRMLNQVPQLRWMTVNLEGGLVTALCAEREKEETPMELSGITNLVATRAGMVRELRVINGFANISPGDLVKPGDILISGIMEWTTHIQVTRSMGEVYADTLREYRVSCPSAALKKHYTGREETCITIIFQRNRKKVSGNSGIFGTSCDRILKTTVLSLPGGYALPVTLETLTLREYTLEPAELSNADAAKLLEDEALRAARAEMISGTVEAKAISMKTNNNRYDCHVSLNCLELISRTVPAELFGEDDTNGKAD